MGKIYNMDLKNKIVEVAGYLFTKYGVRSITMDDIARELSVSKKTIYQHFKDKDEIVNVATQAHLEQEKKEFDDIYSKSANAIEELALISQCMKKNIIDLNPSLLYDLNKYHRKAWEGFLEFKDDFVKNQIKRNLERGVKEKYYRKEIAPDVLAICRMEQIQMAFDDKIFLKRDFDFKQIQMQLFDLFVYGIVTEKGKQLYHEYLKKHTTN